MTIILFISHIQSFLFPSRIYNVFEYVFRTQEGFHLGLMKSLSWTIKKAEHWKIDAFGLCYWGRLLRVPRDCKEIKSVNPKGNQSWIFTGRTDAEAEAPILWLPCANYWFTWNDPNARKDWRPDKKGMAEGEIDGWHYQLDGHEFEQSSVVDDRQGSLPCCSPWGSKNLEMTEQLNWSKQQEEINYKCEIFFPVLSNTWTVNFQMFKLVLEKAEEPEIKLPTSAGSSKKQESSRKISISALLTMPKPLTVWITINCGKFWKRWKYQSTWSASWCRVHHEKHWTGRSTRWNQDFWEKYQ